MQKIPARLLIALLRAYRWLLSPLFTLGFGSACRFHPSCSQYAMDALATHGAARGSWLAVRRVARCHPWHPGGFDPVPPLKSASPHSAHSHPGPNG